MGVAWTEKEVVHLLNRTCFLAGKKEVDACLTLGKEESVRRLIAGQSLTDATSGEMKPLEELKADGKDLKADVIGDQQTYWLYRMATTESPLIEKMTLFWHGHFVTSYQKVKEVHLLLRQNDLFRKYALGNFHELVLEVGKDPAMMLYLDSNNNRKGKPNENYAREVMELFTLGIGNYTEQDIKEAARAFTGWTYDKKLDELKFNKNQHDSGNKSVLGVSGNLDDKAVVDIFFKQEALPRFIAQKLLKFFAVNEPSAEWIEQVAADLKSANTVGEVLNNLFLSDAFYAPDIQGSLIKTPTEYVAGILKAFEIPLSKGFAQASRKMGQELFLPPDVAGWRGGTTWLMTSSLLARYQFAESVAKRLNPKLLGGNDVAAGGIATASDWVERMARQAGIWTLGDQTKQALASYAEDMLVYAQQKTAGIKGLLQLTMISPEAQMK